jgi:hypothetical protein
MRILEDEVMNIRNLYVSIGVAALMATVSVCTAASSAPTTEASIAFANHGGIRNWEADREQGLWVQDSRRNWYYAKLMGPCMGLNFAMGLRFDTRPMGTFDRFSSIVVPREGRCMIQSLVPSEGPPKKQKAAAPAASGSAG